MHAQEIDFNDIRTTLQAYLALSDNCNSLHTNAYDEAITTPTEESVRRAMAIQLIINREFGINQTDNPMQGAYLIEELSDLVEEAVLREFERISDKGGVLGAMESMYQDRKSKRSHCITSNLKTPVKCQLLGLTHFYLKLLRKSKRLNCLDAQMMRKMRQIDRLISFKKKNKEKI